MSFAASAICSRAGDSEGQCSNIALEMTMSPRTLAGAIFAGAPKIVEVEGIALEADFQPVMLFTKNEDKPGFIGALGTILGDAKINIGTLHLGRKRDYREAIAIVGIDEVVPEEIIAELRALPQVSYAKEVRF